MPFASGVFTFATGATNAFSGQTIASATWNAIHTDIQTQINLLPQTARLTTQFDKANQTLGDATGLSVNVTAGRSYIIEAVLFTTSNVAAGVKAAIAGTATATAIIYEAVVYNGAAVSAQTRVTALASAVGGVTAVTVALMRIQGLITVNLGGTLTVQFAQNATNAAVSSVLVGSFLRVSPTMS